MAEETKSTPEVVKTHCYNCDKETNQDLLFKEMELGPREIIWRNEQGDESQSVWEVVADIHHLSKCRGCEKINFKHILRYGPNRDTDEIFHFPRKRLRAVPTWVSKVPMIYMEVLREVYGSLNEQLYVLSLTGLRTLLDIFIVNKIGDVGSFKQKIKKLISEGYITTTKAAVLEAAIEAGNAAAHRGFKPERETLIEVLDVVENLLQSEIVDRNAEKIKAKTPARDHATSNK